MTGPELYFGSAWNPDVDKPQEINRLHGIEVTQPGLEPSGHTQVISPTGHVPLDWDYEPEASDVYDEYSLAMSGDVQFCTDENWVAEEYVTGYLAAAGVWYASFDSPPSPMWVKLAWGACSIMQDPAACTNDNAGYDYSEHPDGGPEFGNENNCFYKGDENWPYPYEMCGVPAISSCVRDRAFRDYELARNNFGSAFYRTDLMQVLVGGGEKMYQLHPASAGGVPTDCGRSWRPTLGATTGENALYPPRAGYDLTPTDEARHNSVVAFRDDCLSYLTPAHELMHNYDADHDAQGGWDPVSPELWPTAASCQERVHLMPAGTAATHCSIPSMYQNNVDLVTACRQDYTCNP